MANPANPNVLEFTSENWAQEVEKSDKPVMVDFWGPGCPPCVQLSLLIDRLANQFAGKVKVGKLNVYDSPDVASKFGITSIPRVFFFNGGDKPKRSIIGLTSEAEMVKIVNSVLLDQ